jgi:hypothetical protein
MSHVLITEGFVALKIRPQYQKIASPPQYARGTQTMGVLLHGENLQIEVQVRKEFRMKITDTESRVHEKESRYRIDWLRGTL